MSSGSGIKHSDTYVFPRAVLGAIEHRLEMQLKDFVFRSELPRCFLAFVGEGEFWEIRPRLMTDPNWHVRYARIGEGMISHVLRTRTFDFWDGSEGKPDYFLPAEQRTVAELAVPIDFQDRITAVLLVDYFENEVIPSRPEVAGKEAIWRHQLERVLGELEREENELRAEILNVTAHCVRETGSIRGYTALKRWDGSIDYFPSGDGIEVFRQLSQLEGVCGEVFRKGEFLNAPDVSKNPNYFPSDRNVRSEAVAPIRLKTVGSGGGPLPLGEGVIGVLNMESHRLDHYNLDRERLIRESAAYLGTRASRFRTPPGTDIGDHSRALSDLIEAFSGPLDTLDVPRERIAVYSGERELSVPSQHLQVEYWALDLLVRRVRTIDAVADAQFTKS